MLIEPSIVKISLAALYLIWNIIVFFLYGADKRKAKRKDWRISETALIMSSVLMGGVGAFFGMKIFRHKTKHLKFKVLVPLAVILNIFIIAAAIYFFVKLEF